MEKEKGTSLFALKVDFNMGQRDCQSEVRDVFEKLGSFRDESIRQLSSIINSHRSSISKGIDELVKEVGHKALDLGHLRWCEIY